jgi:hypothetical protein
MIIERIARALRQQDWFTVVLEVLIVVVGIFIGLQVDGWNEERKLRGQEKVYLERLLMDMSADTDTFTGALDEVRKKGRALILINETILSGDIDNLSPEIYLEALAQSTTYGWKLPQVHTVTFNDLQNSGRIALIRDAALRFAVSDYYVKAGHRDDRIVMRHSGYAGAIYKLVVPNAEVAVFSDERTPILRGAGANAAMEAAVIVMHFLTAANNEELLSLLNAERNYTLFLESQVSLQLLETEKIKTRLTNAIEPEAAQ